MTFLWKNPKTDDNREDTLLVEAFSKIQAMIWFDLDGTVLDANQNFLATLGYSLDEIKGQKHKIFVSPEYAASSEYSQLWDDLKSGKVISGEMSRVTKTGQDIWLLASYNPIVDKDGNPEKIVKFAIDITKTKARAADAAGQIEAIWNTNAVIEFDPDGTIVNANQIFLDAVGYQMDDIKGKHHRMFMTPEDAAGEDYASFWSRLAAGQVISGEQKRVAKGGRELWLQASYVPIRDAHGRIFKVVKYASDITEAKRMAQDTAGQMSAIYRSQAVIEFDLSGTIRTANDNFLDVMGYDLSEIQGKHHSMFVEVKDAASDEYKSFWEALGRGEFQSSIYKRVGKNGKVVWIRASYNPVLDHDGKPYKVVKFASDITDQRLAINMLEDGLTALANGDLNFRIPQDVPDDFMALRDSYNSSIEHLGELVGGILDAAEAIAQDSEVIASNTNDLSTRGEHQASTIEQTTAAMEEISVTVKSNAVNATEASDSAKDAAKNAERGGGIVGDAVAAMERIEQSSSQISKIVEVIDAIAFQTNLLALNAGVEAARAGDAGKGFSVVASEVRGLAQRASEAAKDINDLIEASSKEVAEGSRLVNQSGEALTEIVASVSTVVGSIGDISTASDEQTQSIMEVTHSISEIDAATQQTAALSEESAAAASELAARANDLRALAGHFSYVDNDKSKAATPVERPLEAPRPRQPAAPVAQMKTTQVIEEAPANVFSEEADDEDWQEF